jgi:hypothetical protein
VAYLGLGSVSGIIHLLARLPFAMRIVLVLICSAVSVFYR